MDRQILYPAQIPLVEDGLNAQRNAMVGLGHLAGAAFGTNTVAASGFACSPAEGLSVTIAPGALLAPGVVDASAYGTLAAVSSALVRQFISRDPVSLTVPSAGATYVVYVTPQTVDADDTVLPFYNAADPSVTYAGQNNSGLTAPTVRRDEAALAIGASVPSGAYPLWQIVVPDGATALTADMLSIASGAPFYPSLAAVAPRIVAPFNAQLAAAMGGYPLNAVVADTTTPGTFWVSTADNNTTVPGATGAAWESLFTGLAVLDGGNTFTGAQNITGSLNVTGTITSLLASSTKKIILSRSGTYGGINSYDGSNWHYLIVNDDDTAETAGGILAYQSAVEAETTRATTVENNLQSSKASRAGGNTFDGQQTINVDGQGNPLLIETAKGQGFEFGIAQDTTFLDLHSVTAGNNADYDSRIIATGDITKGTSQLDIVTGSLTWGGNALALRNQLPTAGTITGGTYTKTPMNDGTGRSVLVQRFTVSAVDHAIISFLIPFTTTDGLTINLTPEFQESNTTTNVANYYNTTLSTASFELDLRYLQNSSSGAQETAQIINVTAAGIVS